MSRTPTLFLTIVVLVILAACGTNTAASPTPEPSTSDAPSAAPSEAPSVAPSQAPSEAPSEEPMGSGTLTMVDGVSVGGPGIPVTEALTSGSSEPLLVNGVLLMDPQGTIWLCPAFAGGGIPSCGEPMLRVIGYPENTGDWDIENADVTGLQEAEGVRWFDNAVLYGVVDPA